MSKGFMRISREIENWGWYRDANTFRVFFHLLLKAQYQDGEYFGIKLKRGQVATGRKRLSTELCISEQGIRTAIDHLAKSGEINQQSTNKFTIITICNYDSWQDISETDNQQTNQQLTNNQPTSNAGNNHIQRIINKENKEEINESKKIEKINKKEKDEKFEECWLAYNRKGQKGKARKHWDKLSDEEKELVLPHIKSYVSTREKVYQKDFERYLRDKVFLTVVVKGNDTIYDPARFNTSEYHPTTDGIFLYWSEEKKCLFFNGDINHLDDGYLDEERPDGAKVAHGMYSWIWSKEKKEWVKQ